MRLLRVVLAALDAVTVAGALEGIAPGSARGLVLVAVAAVLAAGILAQRQPPFPM